jgi:hypothetical protein
LEWDEIVLVNFVREFEPAKEYGVFEQVLQEETRVGGGSERTGTYDGQLGRNMECELLGELKRLKK